MDFKVVGHNVMQIMLGVVSIILISFLALFFVDDVGEVSAKSYVSVMNDNLEKKGIEGRLYLNRYKSVQRDGYQVVTVSTTISVDNYESNMDDKLIFVKGNKLFGARWHTSLNELLKGE